MKNFLLIVVFLLSGLANFSGAQVITRYEWVDGDSIPVYVFDEVILKEMKDTAAEKRYLRLVRDVKKTLPYAKLAAFRLQLMEDNLRMITREKERRQYVKKTEKAIKEEFIKDLKNLTVNQGKLLIKLIHRETGKTSFELLDQYSNSFTSVFWQGMAKMYGANLNTAFDPVELYQVEHIIKSLGLE
jgi:hypothetical protein